MLEKIRYIFFSVLARVIATVLFGRYDPKFIALRMAVDADPILSNAWRLATDAHILILKKRYATALALAVLSFEEIGKFLLTEWGKDPEFKYDKSRLHIMKQAAIAALFTTVETREKYRELKVDFKNLSKEEVEKLITALKHGLDSGAPFATLVVGKVYEKIKWSGLYYDPDVAAKGIEPAKVTEDNARELMALTAKAFEALTDRGNIYISRYSFPAVLERVSKDLAQSKITDDPAELSVIR